MDVIEFGAALVDTGDLDPVYIALFGSNLKEKQLLRWLLAYWMYYHSGVASLLSELEGESYYGRMREEEFPRGRERRHFRADSVEKFVDFAERNFTGPENAVESLLGPGGDFPMSYDNFESKIGRFPGFGPWITYKAADMLERLGLSRIHFPASDLNWYKEPRLGATFAREDFLKLGVTGLYDVQRVSDALLRSLSPRLAPPRYERPLGVQEVETVLCKYKAFRHKRYSVGYDINAIRKDLSARDWGVTARRFLSFMPKEVITD